MIPAVFGVLRAADAIFLTRLPDIKERVPFPLPAAHRIYESNVAGASALNWTCPAPNCYGLKADMSTTPARSHEIASLYRRAFAEYGERALWNMQAVETPTPADALAITQALRTDGRMDGRRLAERIEELCRADR